MNEEKNSWFETASFFELLVEFLSNFT